MSVNLTRVYSVRTSPDLLTQRASQITETKGLKPPFPLKAPWGALNPIKITLLRDALPHNVANHYYFGGLPALMQAVRRLEKGPFDPVTYVTDGELPKTLQSGHQGHVHPSEWTAEECSIPNLFKTMLIGLGILAEKSPSDLPHYSYLHFPVSFSEFVKNWMLYGTFFKERLIHNLTSQNGVSQDDRWICGAIAESLKYHQALSKRIEEKIGQKTFIQQGRVYWSPNLTAIQKKEKTWKELGIACEFMSKEEVRRRTLLKSDVGLHILKIPLDGKFYPNASEHIINYLKQSYPNFHHRIAAVEEIAIEEKSQRPLHVIEKDAFGNRIQTIVSTIFGSPGHSEVYLQGKRVWQEVPVIGISSVWRCEVDRKEMMERLDVSTNEELQKAFEEIVPAANLSNLHVTTWDCTIAEDKVAFLARATQGANFNRTIANPLDLENMTNNLNHFFIGKWTLVSVGTCTRKTWVKNVPEFVPLGPQCGFIHGLSGLGYSASAMTIKGVGLSQ